MNTDTHAAGAHDHHHDDGHAHSTFSGYMLGFVLSVVLTAIPFWLVMARPLADGPTAAIILAFAAVQMVVHVIYFLHMSGRHEGGWTMMAMIFTVIIVVIMLTGSLWVMYHLNHNMMPMPHDMSQMP